MEIKKTIKLHIRKEGKNIICKDTATLQIVVGSAGAATDLEHIGVKRGKRSGFIVPITVIKERIKILEERIDRINEKLEIMRQII